MVVSQSYSINEPNLSSSKIRATHLASLSGLSVTFIDHGMLVASVPSIHTYFPSDSLDFDSPIYMLLFVVALKYIISR